jgi:hypothetical protein
MEMIVYGEDGLTLWALKNELGKILKDLNDVTPVENCVIFYRPSFGRSGGKNSSQFGEFDFILLSKNHLYLGESKWDHSSEMIRKGCIHLRAEQALRNEIFQIYIEECSQESDWKSSASSLSHRLESIGKKIPPSGSLLEKNLKDILRMIRAKFQDQMPVIKHILLYLYDQTIQTNVPDKVSCEDDKTTFQLIKLDYSSARHNNTFFISFST